ncbi:hypothetical protein [Ferrovibrio sp.]|uniref:hypothetical protein n=1 Tax=Ferrovibrio sp. TaxID=1917215 RepID=UPI0025BBB824|nr:hypothetical protein [Ferrovibrio sp.]MBX3453858.1 hypothetical protein [Ferrovibrio sp.]
MTDLQRAAILGGVVLGVIAVAGVIGATAVSSYKAQQEAQIHYRSGSNGGVMDRRDCLNNHLATMNRLDRQQIYNKIVDCEQNIQSLEGHMNRERVRAPGEAGSDQQQ